MSKRFNHFLNLLLVLVIAIGLLQTALRFLLGAQIFTQESFLPWFIVTNVIGVFMAVLILKYYQVNKYWLAFSVGVIATISTLIHASVICITLISRQQHPYYLPTLIFSLIAGSLYGISLVFSIAGERLWLKLAGIYLFILNLLVGISVIWAVSSPSLETYTVIEKLGPWFSLGGSLIPILFILNFRDELTLLRNSNADISLQKSSSALLATLGILSLVVVIFGGMLISNSYWSLHWGKKNFEKTQELARLFEARTFVNSKGDTLYYRLLKPLNYDSTKKYPLVINLPYGGQPGTDKIRQLEGAADAQFLSTGFNREKYPAFIFVPNCPAGSGWGGIPNYPSVDALVYEAITSLNEPGIDVKRRYVTGISRGGYGAWQFISTRPDLFAAAIPICGAGDPKLAPRVVDVAVWAFHGAKDQNVPVSGSREMIKAIKEAGGNPKYTEYPNEGHSFYYQDTPGLWDWLFAQRKK
nr:dienelactone hydrolase family protein [Pedobacter panaciterrae]